MIFPIINTAGKVIGFGGRALDDKAMPKYLNSPENRVFQKKNNLYALNSTKQDIGKAGTAIIVEGYMAVSYTHLPKPLVRVTGGKGGEAVLIVGSEKTALHDCGMACFSEELISNIEKALQERPLDYVCLLYTSRCV